MILQGNQFRKCAILHQLSGSVKDQRKTFENLMLYGDFEVDWFKKSVQLCSVLPEMRWIYAELNKWFGFWGFDCTTKSLCAHMQREVGERQMHDIVNCLSFSYVWFKIRKLYACNRHPLLSIYFIGINFNPFIALLNHRHIKFLCVCVCVSCVSLSRDVPLYGYWTIMQNTRFPGYTFPHSNLYVTA